MLNECRGDFDLNYFEDGILSSAFMVGLLVASPIFASLAKRFFSLVMYLILFCKFMEIKGHGYCFVNNYKRSVMLFFSNS